MLELDEDTLLDELTLLLLLTLELDDVLEELLLTDDEELTLELLL